MGCVSPSSYIWKSYKQMRSVCEQAHLHDKQQHCDFCLLYMVPATLVVGCPCAWIPLVPFFIAKRTQTHSLFIQQASSSISFCCFYKTMLRTEFSHSVALWEGSGRKNSLYSLPWPDEFQINRGENFPSSTGLYSSILARFLAFPDTAGPAWHKCVDLQTKCLVHIGDAQGPSGVVMSPHPWNFSRPNFCIHFSSHKNLAFSLHSACSNFTRAFRYKQLWTVKKTGQRSFYSPYRSGK